MLRLAKIPNSRCLAKIKTNGKKPKLPRPKEPSSVELQVLPLARGCPAAYGMASPGREEMGHDRVDAPTQEGGTDLESEAGREGRKHQLNFLEASPVQYFWHHVAAAEAGMGSDPSATHTNSSKHPVLARADFLCLLVFHRWSCCFSVSQRRQQELGSFP